MTGEQRARWIVLGLVLLGLGCDGPPAAPSPPAVPEPAEAVATLEFEPLTVKAGEFGYEDLTRKGLIRQPFGGVVS